MTTPIVLTSSHVDKRPFKTCDYCGKQAIQSDGCQVTASKWKCAKCFRIAGFRRTSGAKKF